MKCLFKMLVTAAAGWAAFNAAVFVTFRLIGFGAHGQGVLLEPQTQSAKLIAVWTKLEPLPLVVGRPQVIIAGLFGFAFLQSAIYKLLAPAWPTGVGPRALRLAALRFTLTFLFWEFFTPFNQFGEPLDRGGTFLLGRRGVGRILCHRCHRRITFENRRISERGIVCSLVR